MIRRILWKRLTQRIDTRVPRYRKEVFFIRFLHGYSRVEEALDSSEKAMEIFQEKNLPNCRFCPVHKEETIAEASQNYNFSLEEWLIDLNFEIFQSRQEKIQKIYYSIED